MVPEEADAVRKVFDLYNAGTRVLDIRDRLISSGTPQKGKHKLTRQWAQSVIYEMLRSESYTGTLIWRFADGTETRLVIPQIITSEQWARVRQRLRSNAQLSTRNAGWV